eukprot:gene12764-7038_t
MRQFLVFLLALVAVTLVKAEADELFLKEAFGTLKKVGKKVGKKAFGAFEDAAMFAKNAFDQSEEKLSAKYSKYPNYNDPQTRYIQSLAAQVALDIVYRSNANEFNPTQGAGWNQGWKNDVFVVGKLLRLLVLHNEKDKTAILSIAGTRLVARDWASLGRVDYHYWHEDPLFRHMPGKIHTGMYKKIRTAWNSSGFKSLVSKLLKDKYTIVVSGHSQGGGHAGILGGQLHYHATHNLKLPKPYLQILTFGSVRIGDRKFAKYVQENVRYITRVRHKMDAAPSYPPPRAFYHAGKLMLFNCLHTPLHCHASDRYYKNFLRKMGTQKLLAAYPIRDNCKGSCYVGSTCEIIH